MISEPLSYVAAFIAMVLVCSSYFYGKKKTYLLLQAVGIVFLMCSYLFGGAYFAMIGMGVGLARTFTYYAYEKADKTAPVALAVLFSALTLAAYFLVNFALLKTAQTIDLAYLVSLILFAVFFRNSSSLSFKFITCKLKEKQTQNHMLILRGFN